MFDKKITTESEAKKFFMDMDCSTFVMGREYPQKYKEYKLLNISKQTELKWKKEKLERYYNIIYTRSNKESLWVIYNKMYELVSSLKTEQSLKIIFNTTENIISDLKEKERVIIAETIIGRKQRSQRSGLIYLSYDLNSPNISKSFAKLVLWLLKLEKSEGDILNRAKNARKLCQDIMLELNI